MFLIKGTVEERVSQLPASQLSSRVSRLVTETAYLPGRQHMFQVHWVLSNPTIGGLWNVSHRKALLFVSPGRALQQETLRLQQETLRHEC